MPWLSWKMTVNIPSLGWCLTMSEIIRLSDNQLKRVKELVYKRCCNFSDGACLMLDWSFCNICPQCHSNRLCCKWFRHAVLPNDPKLEADIFKISPRKRCIVCNEPVFSKSNRAKYCPVCAKNERKRKESIRLHNHYLKSRI